MLALEGNAAEVLKEISDSSPSVLQDIWDALSQPFGEVDEASVKKSSIKNKVRKSSKAALMSVSQSLII